MEPSMSSSIMSSKNALRVQVSEILRRLNQTEIMDQSRIITEKLVSSNEWKQAKRLSIYLSMPNEVQTDGAVTLAMAQGKDCFVPLCRGGRMRMLKLDGESDLRSLPSNSWGIREPLPTEGREDALETGGVDLVVCPVVAVSKEGHRLGHGKGYYDMFLKEMIELNKKNGTGTPAIIAVAFKQQILKDVPITDQDYIMPKVITP